MVKLRAIRRACPTRYREGTSASSRGPISTDDFNYDVEISKFG